MQRSMLTKFVCFLLFLAMTLYAAWSWFFQVSLYAVLIRLQSNHFDVYYPIITGVAMWLLLALVPLAYAYGGKQLHDFQLTYQQLSRRLKFRSARLFMWTVILASLAAGAYRISQVIPGDDQDAIPIDLASEELPWLWFKKVSLNGEQVQDSVVLNEAAVADDGTTTFRRYIPIAPPAESDQPIRFVESLTSDSLQRINRDPVAMTGFVLPQAVPVRVRDSFLQDGLQIARYPYVISNNGFNGQNLFYIMAAILGLLAAVLLIKLLASPIYNRQRLLECKEHQGRW